MRLSLNALPGVVDLPNVYASLCQATNIDNNVGRPCLSLSCLVLLSLLHRKSHMYKMWMYTVIS